MIHLCPKCNTLLIKCMATGVISKFSAVKLPEKVFGAKETSELFPYVCPVCGYAEWYVEKPENFK